MSYYIFSVFVDLGFDSVASKGLKPSICTHGGHKAISTSVKTFLEHLWEKKKWVEMFL